MNYAPILASALLLVGSTSAWATSVNKSIDACKAAIGEQTQLSDPRFNVQKIKTRASNREVNFVVSSGEHKTKAKCKVKKNGVVLALTVDGQSQPVAAADSKGAPRT